MAKQSDPLAKELDAIKRLLVLQLLMSGVQANAVAAALGVAKSAVSKLVPARKVKKKAKQKAKKAKKAKGR